jgi:hypothetical protein
MDDAVAVGVVQRLGYFPGDSQGGVDRQLPGLQQPLAEGWALHERHHIIETTIVLT